MAFFVLSAFLLTNKFMHSGFSFASVMSYFVGRVLRIVPLFSLVVLLYFLLGTAGVDTAHDLKSALLFQSGYAHLWTIPVEFKFYFVLPFFAWSLLFTLRLYGAGFVLPASALALIVHQVAAPYWETPENSINTYWYLPSFMFGCCAAVFQDFSRKIVTSKTSTVVTVVCVAAIVLMMPWGRNYFFGAPLDNWLQNKFVFLSFILSIFLLFSIDAKGIIGLLLTSPPLKRLREWSFSIYLVH
ncbi:acyltransferase family protein [Pseudomonas sp. H11T01]|uniref:acyltransferase family protein n=1 Tax=Pseudomonas sp. H11T01 TaxID=3402749 RepID=UPI003AD2CE50